MSSSNSATGPRGAKKANDLNKGLQRRIQQNISLRQDKRNQMVEKKRKLGGHSERVGGGGGAGGNDIYAFDHSTLPNDIPVELLPQFAEIAMGDNDEEVMHGVLMIRKLLSVEDDPPIDEIIESGVLPRMVECMQREDMPQLQFEAAWALTNIASGTEEQTNIVVGHNAVPLFVNLLSSPNPDCREQATWALGNLAGEGPKFRDVVIRNNAIPALLNLINQHHETISSLRNAVWCLSNLCRSKPQPRLEDTVPTLPVLASLLNNQDDQVIADAAWALSYISDGPTERVQVVLEAGVLPRVVELLQKPSSSLLLPSIRIVGNICAGTDRQTQTAINSGCLPHLHLLLSNEKRAIRKETCWTLSNITAGNKEQIQAVINANLMPYVLKCLTHAELEVVKEAVWTIANLTNGGAREQIQYALEIGVLEPLCNLLKLFDMKITSVALEALENLLLAGEEDQRERGLETNIVADAVYSLGGAERLIDLQSHSHQDVSMYSTNLCERFFETDADGAEGAGLSSGPSGFDFTPEGDNNQQSGGGFNF